MKKISLWMLVCALAVPGVQAQDAATQQQIDKISGQLQDIIDAEAAQGKRLDALEHDVAELREKVNTPVVNNYASADDLQKLVTQVQEVDRRRLEDREKIQAKIEDLAKIMSAAPVPTHSHHSEVKEESDDTTPAPPADNPPQKMYKYSVQAGDTLSAIAKAYHEKGVKVTTSQILKANPGLSPNALYVGKTILIPDFSK